MHLTELLDCSPIFILGYMTPRRIFLVANNEGGSDQTSILPLFTDFVLATDYLNQFPEQRKGGLTTLVIKDLRALEDILVVANFLNSSLRAILLNPTAAMTGVTMELPTVEEALLAIKDRLASSS